MRKILPLSVIVAKESLASIAAETWENTKLRKEFVEFSEHFVSIENKKVLGLRPIAKLTGNLPKEELYRQYYEEIQVLVLHEMREVLAAAEIPVERWKVFPRLLEGLDHQDAIDLSLPSGK